MTDVASVNMMWLYLKVDTKRWKGKGRASDNYETNHLHFRDILKKNHYRELNKDQKKSTMEYCMFLKKNKDGTIKVITVAEGNKKRDFI